MKDLILNVNMRTVSFHFLLNVPEVCLFFASLEDAGFNTDKLSVTYGDGAELVKVSGVHSYAEAYAKATERWQEEQWELNHPEE